MLANQAARAADPTILKLVLKPSLRQLYELMVGTVVYGTVEERLEKTVGLLLRFMCGALGEHIGHSDMVWADSLPLTLASALTTDRSDPSIDNYDVSPFPHNYVF